MAKRLNDWPWHVRWRDEGLPELRSCAHEGHQCAVVVVCREVERERHVRQVAITHQRDLEDDTDLLLAHLVGVIVAHIPPGGERAVSLAALHGEIERGRPAV